MSLATDWLENYWGHNVYETVPQLMPIHVLVEYLEAASNHALERAAQEAERVSKQGMSGHDPERGWWDARDEIVKAIRALKHTPESGSE